MPGAESQGVHCMSEKVEHIVESVAYHDVEDGAVELSATPVERLKLGHHIQGEIEEFGQTNAKTYVTLRFEFMTQRAMKALQWSVWSLIIIGSFFLVWAFVRKLGKDGSSHYAHHAQDDPLVKANLAIASLNLAGLSMTITAVVIRVGQAHRRRLIWSVRRAHVVGMLFFECCVQWVNSLFFLLPNVVLFAGRCNSLELVVASTSIRWACWNVVWCTSLVNLENVMPLDVPLHGVPWHQRLVERTAGMTSIRHNWRTRIPQDIDPRYAMVMDLPLSTQIPKVILTLPGICLSIALGIAIYFYVQNGQMVYGEPIPTGQDYFVYTCERSIKCKLPASVIVIASLLSAAFVFKTVVLLLLQHATHKQLHRKPYCAMRLANITHRLMARDRIIVFAFIGFCVALLWMVNIQSCSTHFYGVFGFLPMQFVSSGFLCCVMWVYMPSGQREKSQKDQSVLRECAWTEEAQHQIHCSKDLGDESLFCFERMLKLAYWSYLVYDKTNLYGMPRYTVEMALELYGLQHYEVIWDRVTDTKAIIGWGVDTIVLAFRGTASKENVITDMKIWTTPYPPSNHKCCLARHSRVHGGFLEAWTANEYSKTVLGSVKSILQEMQVTNHNTATIYVTGHSLGGALATLASYEIATELGNLRKMQISCYTFGCPRVGNKAFASMCHAAVQDSWHVIFDNDIVTRALNSFGLYKRTPKCLFMFPSGTMVVRPTYLENNLFKSAGAGDRHQHHLTSYLHAMREVIISNFVHHDSLVAKTGVRSMLQQPVMSKFLGDYLGMELHMLNHGLVEAEEVLQRTHLVKPGFKIRGQG